MTIILNLQEYKNKELNYLSEKSKTKEEPHFKSEKR